MSPVGRKPWHRRRNTWWAEEVVRRYGLTEVELTRLANYNMERGHGAMHTKVWQAQMAELQRRYNDALSLPS